jgi:AcrR family transcriptional regulator
MSGAPLDDARLAKGEQTRRTILDHALRVASKEGFSGLSIGALARDLQMSKSGLFAHFQSKQRLQVDVMLAGEQRFIDFVVRPALQEPRGEPRLRAMIHRWSRWALADGPPGGCVFVAAASELDDQPGPLRENLSRTQRDWTGTLTRAVELGVEAGHFRSNTDCGQVAFELYSTLLGLHLYHRLLRRPDALDLCGHAVDRIFDSIRADVPRD